MPGEKKLGVKTCSMGAWGRLTLLGWEGGGIDSEVLLQSRKGERGPEEQAGAGT